MKIEILGSGCSRCHALTKNVEIALAQLDKKAEIIPVTNISEIMEYGIMSTPALVIDKKVKAFGHVASVEEIKKIILEN